MKEEHNKKRLKNTFKAITINVVVNKRTIEKNKNRKETRKHKQLQLNPNMKALEQQSLVMTEQRAFLI